MALIGEEGKGWDQVHGRAGLRAQWPERFLSSIALLHTALH